MRKKKSIKKKRVRSDTSSKKRKVVKKKAVAKKRATKVPRTRNSGTFTEAMFWGWIRSSLRKRAMRGWKPISDVRNRARISYVGENKRRKYSYICEECGGEFDGKQVAVHHIEECGSLTCAADLEGFVERLFCEVDGLALLCSKCHNKKHEK